MADRIVVMNAGEIEQIGTPLELYDRPTNLFVAGFIGSPAMNLFQGRGSPDGLKMPDGAILPCKLSSDLQKRDIVVGVRPEHFEISDSGADAELLTIEPTGPETQIMIRIAGGEALVSFRERLGVAAGDQLNLRPMDDKVHIFDAASGKRINQ